MHIKFYLYILHQEVADFTDEEARLAMQCSRVSAVQALILTCGVI